MNVTSGLAFLVLALKNKSCMHDRTGQQTGRLIVWPLH